MSELIMKAKKLMHEKTQKNGAPAWSLTELAVEKGRELAKKYSVDEELVVVSLYLAHTVFSPIWKGEIQKNHPELSAKFVKKYLDEWKVPDDKQEIIINSIEAHHNKVPIKSLIAEVVKNAECFKFVTLKGELMLIHEFGKRGLPFEEAVEKALEKMNQKKSLLTLKDCKKEAEKNCKEIEEVFAKTI